MKRKLLIQMAGIVLISCLFSVHLFSSKKDVSDKDIPVITEVKEQSIFKTTELETPSYRAVLDVIYSQNLASHFANPWAMFEYKGTLYIAPGPVNAANPLGKMYKYNTNDLSASIGDVIISGVTGTQQFWGFTTDGEYIYGVNETENIFVIDPSTMTVTNTITASGLELAPTMIAYDIENDGFWVATVAYDRIYFLKKNGEIVAGKSHQISRLSGLTGLAYDNRTPGGPYLWITHGSHYYNATSRLGRFNLTTETYEEQKALETLGTQKGFNYGGPIYIYGDIDRGKNILTGMIPAGVDSKESSVIYGLELGDYPKAATPQGVKDFKVEPAEQGLQKAKITWVNPDKTMDGSSLSSLKYVKIYRSDLTEELKIYNSPTVGASMEYEDETPGSMLYTYRIVAENNSGVGMAVEVKAYVGQDIPLPVTDLLLNNDNGNAKITWTPPTGGKHGGYINFANLKYRVVRLPDNMILSTDFTGTQYIDNTITSLGNYSYVVTARSATGYGEPTTSNSVQLGNAMTVPWNENFDIPASFPLWTIIDGDGSGNKWLLGEGGGKDRTNCAKVGQARNTTQNAWLISAAISLEAGKKYRLNWYEAYSNATRKYDITIGNAATVEAQSTVLGSFTTSSGVFTQKEAYVTVTTSGKYHIGWHSEMPKYTGIWATSLSIDDIQLEEVNPYDLEAVSLTGPVMPSVDREFTYNVTVKNWGAQTATGFTVSLLNSSNQELSSTIYNGNILTEETAVVPVKWTPTQTGIQDIKAKVIINQDVNPENDISPAFTIDVQKAGILGIEIGHDETTGQIPFSYYKRSSFVQSIYYEEEINNIGLIDSITYYNDFLSGSIGEKRIQIYMSITQKDEMTAWDMSKAVLVFDGLYNFPKGQNDCVIRLNTPFGYSGGNMIITTVRPMDERYYGSADKFRYSTSEEHPNRTLSYSDDKTEFDFSQLGISGNQYANIKIMMNTNVGKLQGVVKDENGVLENAKVSVKETGVEVQTDETGKFLLLLEPGTYDLEVSKTGYEIKTQQITIAIGENKNLDFELNPIEHVTLTGEVKDNEGVLLENAVVKLIGYENYQVSTNAEGKFNIENVFVNEEYSITVEKSGYILYTSTVSVETDDVDLPAITLVSCGNPTVKNLEYNLTGEDKYTVGLSWYSPNSTGEKFATPIYAGNDSVITTKGAAKDGFDWSEVYEDDGSGFVINKNGEYPSIADDFVLTDNSFITDMDFYVYQLSATTPRLAAVYMQIYNGKPDAGGTVVWGDMETNILIQSEFMGCYRVKEKGELGLNDRNASILRAKAKVQTELAAGTYWLEVSFESKDQNKQIVIIPCSAKGHRILGNAIYKNSSGEWSEVRLGEVSGKATQGIAFAVNGVKEGEDYPTHYKIYRDNVHIETIPYYQYAYSNRVPGAGIYTFEISTIWNNECESQRSSVEVEVELDICETPITDFPFYENFDDGEISSCWKQQLLNGGERWFISQGVKSSSGVPGSAHSGAYNITYETINRGDMARIITPRMDTRQLNKIYLSFYHAQAVWTNGQDILRVYYKIGKDGELNKVAEYTQNIREWTRRLIELPATAKSEELYIVFEGESQNGYGIVLDDISISDDGCYPVNNYEVKQIWEKIHLTWTEPPVPVESYTIKRNGDVIAENILPTDHFEDANIKNGETYNYCVQANYAGNDCNNERCESITAKIDICHAVTNLQAKQIKDHTVYMSWDMEELSEDIEYFAIGIDGSTHGSVSSTERSVLVDITGMERGNHTFCVIVAYKDRSCPTSLAECEVINIIWVGIDNEPAAKPVKVYPNPVKDGYLMVEGSDIQKIDIHNPMGQLAQSIIYTHDETERTINVSNYPAGVYIVKIYTADNRVITEKVIITN